MTPEKALGRLINLREQWRENSHDVPFGVSFHEDDFGDMSDDLDDIIQSIERDVKEPETFECPSCGYDGSMYDDSEDTEA